MGPAPLEHFWVRQYAGQRWHRNLFWRFRKFRVSDYSFRNLIRNSKPHPKPETSTETRNLNRNPETAKTSIIYLFILSKVGAETLLCQIRKFRASDYNFRNLIRNSKPHPKPETSFEPKPHLNTKNYPNFHIH